jgi:hypothetical protein
MLKTYRKYGHGEKYVCDIVGNLKKYLLLDTAVDRTILKCIFWK